VNGEYGGFVEGVQRRVEAGAHALTIPSAMALDGSDQTGGERVTRGDVALQKAEDIDDPAADTLAQLGGSGIGKRDHQDLLDGELAFEQQAQVQATDVPGLAGAGGRFDQMPAVEWAGEYVEVARFVCAGRCRRVHDRGSSR
jgi:hypothetical protein